MQPIQQIDADGVLRDLDTGEKKRFISHPNSYNIVESIEEESLNLPERTFLLSGYALHLEKKQKE